MARGERRGTIVQRGPELWLVRVAAGRDPARLTKSGQPRYLRVNKLVRGTRKDAERVLTGLLATQDKGARLPVGRRTLGQWLDDYATTWSAHLSPRSREKAAEILRLYLPAPLRAMQLTAITPGHLQDVYLALAVTKSPSTVSLLHRTLRSRLTKAVELGLLLANPAKLVRPPAVKRRDYRVLSPDEARRFVVLAEGTRFAPLWTLLLATGLRPEEALAVTWDDLDGTTLRVRRALVRTKRGKWEMRPTKTDTGRAVSLPTAAVKALQRHRAKQAGYRLALGSEYAGHGLIFTTEDGKPLDWRTLAQRYFGPLRARLALELVGEPSDPPTRRRTSLSAYRAARTGYEERVRKALEKTGLDRLRPYDLRHSAASLMLAQDLHPKIVSAQLGHSSINLTLDTYSHLVPGLQDRAAGAMDAVLDAPEPKAGAKGSA